MLAWQLKNSDRLPHLERFQKLKDAGQDIPFLRNVPQLNPAYGWIWEGFGVLASQRMFGPDGTVQPIQISEIASYCAFAGIDDEADREDFLRIILALDGIALDFARQKLEKARNKGAKGPKAGSAHGKGRRR